MARVVPDVLKRLRAAKRISLDELADRAKINRQTIYRLEKGPNGNTRDRTIQQLAKALGTEPAVLAGEKLPGSQDEDRSYFLMSKLGFRISTSAHNAMYLITERYDVKYADIVELAPFLFCWAAEASLRRRERKLRDVEVALEAASKLQREISHLNVFDLTEAREAIGAERESIKFKDLFGLSSDSHFKLDDWRDNPFASFLKSLTETIGEDADFEGYSYMDYPQYRVCAQEAAALADGDDELIKHILEGHVALNDLPKELREISLRKERAEWLRNKAEEFQSEMLERIA
jgi:transcriptional regulator with XRE-family HTH domain